MSDRSFLLIVALLVGANCSTPNADPVGEVVDDLLRTSGFERQIAPFADNVSEELLAGMVEPRAGLRVELAELARRAFSASELRAEVRARLIGDLNEVHAQAVLAWLRSDLGKSIAALEEKATTEYDEAEMREFVARLRGRPPRAERIALVQRLNSVSHLTEFSVAISLATVRASAIALNAAGPVPMGDDAVEALVARERGGIAASQFAIQELGSLVTYETVSDDDLAAYCDFLETNAGQWYTRATTRALLGGYESATKRLTTAAEHLRPPSDEETL